MSEKSFARFRAISIAIFVVGAVSAGFAYSLHKRNVPQLRHRKGFTLRTRDTNVLFVPRLQPFPNEIAYADTIRYQKSDGTFKTVRTYYHVTGRVVKKEITFGIPGQGVFSINNPHGPLNFLSSMPPKEERSYVPVTDGHNQPNFLKDDWVQGYQTYVLRFLDQEGGYTDMYCALELDGEPIRTVTVSPNGISLEEVVQIKLGDPEDRVFGPLPKLLVNYDHFKSKIAAMEEAGKHDSAEAMQRELDEQIAKEMKDQVLLPGLLVVASATQQSKERLIRRMALEQNEPIAITAIKVNDGSVSFDKKFTADDEWLRSLVVSVKNKSDKLILFASIRLQFPRPTGSRDTPAIYDMSYGNWALQTHRPTSQEMLVGTSPGETVEIRLSDQQFVALREFLTATNYPSSIEKVDLIIGHVIFADDTMWYGEKFRRDSNDPTSWIPSRPPDSKLR